jgi:hypothetical protein
MLGQLPHRALKDFADKYGPIMLLQLGSVPTLVVSAPEMAKHFLQTHDLVFASRPSTAAGKYLVYNFKEIIRPLWRSLEKNMHLRTVHCQKNRGGGVCNDTLYLEGKRERGQTCECEQGALVLHDKYNMQTADGQKMSDQRAR